MSGIIRWFTDNSVAANVLMILIIAGGATTVFSLRQEIFPEFSADLITVSVAYPGATPTEVEESICIKIEEQIQGVDGIKEVRSSSDEGAGVVTVEVKPGQDLRRVLDDVKTRVDAIVTFPAEAEKPVIQEVIIRRQVLNVAISGQVDELGIKRLGERVRDELALIEGLSQVDLLSARPYEISIELSEEQLRRFGLSFDEVVQAVRVRSLDLPGGSIKTDGGEVLLRSMGQAYVGADFERLALRARRDGSRLLLSDVATVVDGFAETDQSSRFDHENSVMVRVYRVGDEDAVEIASKVYEYIDEAQSWLPAGVHMTVWDDMSVHLKGRRDLLLRNGMTGLGLVFLVLALFLRFRLALWVSLGIPVSFLGAIWLMPVLGVTINLITLFAFILVLGIVVDDAIVVGENIYTHFRRHGDAMRAAVEGTQEVATPVIFGVLTTVTAFIPLTMIPGNTGKIWKVIPLIVIPVLLFSLIESKLILPAHLRHLKAEGSGGKQRPRLSRFWYTIQERVARGLEDFVERRYQPFLDLCLRWRYAAVATGVACLLLTVGYVAGGFLKFTFMPEVESESITASIEMPLGTPVQQTNDAVDRLERVAESLRREFAEESGGRPVILHSFAAVGDQPSALSGGGPIGPPKGTFSGAHLGEVTLELVPSADREISAVEIAKLWRERSGEIPGASSLTFQSSLFRAGDAIDIQLASHELEDLVAVTRALRERLGGYAGVQDIRDNYRQGKREIQLEILPEGELLGLTQADLARQVRQAFYGAEAQRIQRGRDEVKVMVRYPRSSRASLEDLRQMRVRLPGGIEAPLSRVARAEMKRGFSTIQRVQRQRVINVTADVDDAVANATEIIQAVTSRDLPEILADYPGVRWRIEGEQKEQRESMRGLVRGFAVILVVIYAMMAIPFRSYLHAMVVMSAVPFGLVGAIWGHILMGMSLSVLSVVGMVALTGVVVNDSLVLVDYVNRRRREGIDMHTAVRRAGAARFRAILLTSITTFAGLTPMLLERSLQARFLIPLAVSLAFGVVFSTVVTLVLVPSGYLILEDLLALPRRLRQRFAPGARVAS
jgi:multidrug efflux pump subunit AcrB